MAIQKSNNREIPYSGLNIFSGTFALLMLILGAVGLLILMGVPLFT